MIMRQWMINIIFLLLALFAIFLALIKVTPFDVTESTYVGIIVSLLALATTLVIGYQIYNAVELRKDISEQKRCYDAILKKSEEMERKFKEQAYEQQEGFDILASLIRYNSGQHMFVCGEAFYSMHHALLSSIRSNRTDYGWIFNYLREFIAEFEVKTITQGLSLVIKNDGNHYINTPGPYFERSFKSFIDEYLAPIKEDEKLLRSDENFIKIQYEYNRIIKLFYDRINEIQMNPMKTLSPEEINKIINPNY